LIGTILWCSGIVGGGRRRAQVIGLVIGVVVFIFLGFYLLALPIQS
jgi:hypothetical protein